MKKLIITSFVALIASCSGLQSVTGIQTPSLLLHKIEGKFDKSIEHGYGWGIAMPSFSAARTFVKLDTLERWREIESGQDDHLYVYYRQVKGDSVIVIDSRKKLTGFYFKITYSK